MVNNSYDGMRITSNNLQDYLSPKPTENSIVPNIAFVLR